MGNIPFLPSSFDTTAVLMENRMVSVHHNSRMNQLLHIRTRTGSFHSGKRCSPFLCSSVVFPGFTSGSPHCRACCYSGRSMESNCQGQNHRLEDQRKEILVIQRRGAGGNPCCSLSIYIFLPHFHKDSSCTDIHDSYIISGQKKKVVMRCGRNAKVERAGDGNPKFCIRG